MKYKNIIFDLGNVIVKLDDDATKNAFERLGLGTSDYIRKNRKALFQGMGIGLLSNEEFFDEFRKLANSNATDKQITDAANAMLCCIPDAKKQKLLNLRQSGHRTFLLSNTIDLHWNYCVNTLFPMGKFSVKDYFEQTFVSQEIHMTKPDDIIFQTVIKDTGIIPEETLFIDDMEVNCAAAERNGIHAFQNKEFDDWMKLFD